MTTWNPTGAGTAVVFSGGNLTITTPTVQPDNNIVKATDPLGTAKVYWEVTVANMGTRSDGPGIALLAQQANSGFLGGPNSVGIYNETTSALRFHHNFIESADFGVAFTTNGTLLGIAIDPVARKIWVRQGAAGQWLGDNTSHNPATGLGGYTYPNLGTMYAAATLSNAGAAITANFGASTFAGAVPSGYVAYDGSSGGPTIVSGTGTAAGGSTASGVGRALKATTGTAAGAGTATGQGRALKAATGSAAGSATAAGSGRAIKRSDGVAAGGSTAQATNETPGAPTIITGQGTAAGGSTATAAGFALVLDQPSSGARGGGGGGPASQATVDARQRHERRRRERQDRIDATIEGRPQPKPKTAPAPSQRLTEPLPPARDALAELLELLNAEQLPLLPVPLVRPFDTGEENDIEALLLLD